MDNRLKRVSVDHRDNFVAYLDGELSAEDSKEIERVIADSPVARKDIELLVRTYDMLDLLPRPAATVEFTQRTMATIKLSDLKPDVTQAPWYRRMQMGIAGSVGLGLLALTGLIAYASTNRWVPTNEDLLLQDLHVIKNLDDYSQIGQHEFIDRLREQPHLLQTITEEAAKNHGR